MAPGVGVTVLPDPAIQLHARWLLGAVCHSKRTHHRLWLRRRRARVDGVGWDGSVVSDTTLFPPRTAPTEVEGGGQFVARLIVFAPLLGFETRHFDDLTEEVVAQPVGF